jgi:xylulokinase
MIAAIGNPILPGYTAPKVLWLKKNKPEAFTALKHILLPHDYLNYYLTGRYCTEYGDASGTALFDVRSRSWAAGIASLIDPGIPSCLPRLLEPSEPAGYITSAAAREFGFPEGMPVSSGGGDNMMSAVGTGTVHDGIMTVSLGTSGTLFGFSDTPVVDRLGRVAAFCSSTGGWLPLLCTMNCTVATEQARNLLGVGLESLENMAARASVGSEGVVTLPFYNGERSPNLPNGRAGIMGLTASNLTPQNILRSAMESAIFGLRGGLDAFRSLGFTPRSIRLTGGGSRSPLWRTITANILGFPLEVPESDEGAAFGASLQALWCASRLNGRGRDIGDIVEEHVRINTADSVLPDRETAEVYEKAYAVYLSYLEALKPLYV